ncbi:MAG: hypothetical protein KDJ16_15065 [Hyphomicrobiales bacterium]|nr:hypothetical protein [Hyphomicrobiales bacterium]
MRTDEMDIHELIDAGLIRGRRLRSAAFHGSFQHLGHWISTLFRREDTRLAGLAGRPCH